MEFVQVSAAFSDKEQAARVAKALVAKRLAACAQVAGPVLSTYWWQGVIETATEWVCTAKTTLRLYPQVETLIKQMHSYSVPEILATPLVEGSGEYLEWLRNELSKE